MIEIHSFEGRSLEEAKERALYDLKKSNKDIIYKASEEKAGLFKGKKVELQVILADEVVSFVKDYLTNIAKYMGIELNTEVKKREEAIKFSMFSDNKTILIGKNGKTIDALQLLVKQALFNEIGIHVNVIIDTEDYKEKKQEGIERLAKSVAREVVKTKIETRLRYMNAYERRIVHATLTDYHGIQTESEGEEPNRCVVIKPAN